MRDLLPVSVIMVTDLLSFTRRSYTAAKAESIYFTDEGQIASWGFYIVEKSVQHTTHDCSTAWGDCESVFLRLTIESPFTCVVLISL